MPRKTRSSKSIKKTPIKSRIVAKASKSILQYFSPSKNDINSGDSNDDAKQTVTRATAATRTSAAPVATTRRTTRGRQGAKVALGKLNPNTIHKTHTAALARSTKRTTRSTTADVNADVDANTDAIDIADGSDGDIIAITTKKRKLQPDVAEFLNENEDQSQAHNCIQQMALVQIRSTTTLAQLAHSLSSHTNDNDTDNDQDNKNNKDNNRLGHLFHLFPNATLGRNETKQIPNKVSLNIPMTESGVSRKQVLVTSITPPKAKYKGIPPTYHDAIQYHQHNSPSITIENKGNNVILIIKARIHTNVLSRRELTEHVHMLKRNEQIILKVGDSIVFDAYHYQHNMKNNDGDDDDGDGVQNRGQKGKQKGKYAKKKKREEAICINGCQCVYRLVAVKEKTQGALEVVEKEKEFMHVKRIKVINDQEWQQDDNNNQEEDGKDMQDDNKEVEEERVVAIKEVKTVRKSSRTIRKCAILTGEQITIPFAPSAQKENNMLVALPNNGEGETPFPDVNPVAATKRILVEKSMANVLKTNVQGPKVGDKVRMIFSQRDLFVGKHTMWFIGTITLVSNESGFACALKIKWDDSTEDEHIYPNDDMELISPNKSLGPSSYSTEAVPSTIAFDLSPTVLNVGDHVQCYYQNGLSGGQWWPGRIAAVNTDEDRVDIAYLDGEFEVGVPMHEGKIHFIESGIESASKWLTGAEFTPICSSDVGISEGKSEITEVHGCKDEETGCESVLCKVRNSQSNIAEMSYVTVVEALFSELHKEKCHAGKALLWPGFSCPIFLQTKDAVKKKRKEVRFDINPSNPFAALGISIDDGNDNGSNIQIAQDCSLDNAFDNDEVLSNENGPITSKMDSSLANACWRNLESNETQNGFSALAHALSSWKYVPNEKLNVSFSEFLTSGPVHELTQIHEPHRTELVFAYLDKVLNTMRDKDCYSARMIKPPNFEALLSLTTTDTNESYILTATDAEIHRLTRALQFCSKSLGFAAKAITIELQRIARGEIEATTKILSNLNFAASFLQGNTRENLKLTVKNSIQVLVRHGHWLAVFPGEDKQKNKNPRISSCAIEVQNCVKALGVLVSHATWLYCAKEEVPFPDRNCCFLIKDIVETELAKIDYSKISSKKKVGTRAKNKYMTELKLRFLFAMHTKFSEDLQLELSQLFGLSKEVKLILC